MVVCSFAQENEFITSDGVRLYVKVKGEGTPCLYIHGGPGAGSYWLEHFFGDFLEQHFQMIYMDQRGVGRSTSPKDQNFSLKRMVQDFEEVRTHLGITEWLTLGHSFGGIMQMAYVEAYPKSVKGMMMFNCTLNLKETFCSSWIPKAAALSGEEYSITADDAPEKILNEMIRIGSALDEKVLRWEMAYASATSG